MRCLMYCVLGMLLAFPAYASTDARGAFERLNECIGAGNAPACRPYLTRTSTELYDRFTGYGLLSCLPANARFLSEKQEGAFTIIRASAGQKPNGKRDTLRLAFAQEDGAWKLDVPESLRGAMGKNWRTQVNLTEQMYLVLRQRMGGALDCNTVQALVKK